jgi:hypothetical protein
MQEVDQRITQAREYLAWVQQTDVLHMPPSALLREAAESRRQLGQVLDAVADLEDAAAKLSAIRSVLDTFGWESGDRQIALEAIDRIQAGGER